MANSESIRISVVIPAYNNAAWIARAVESVLSQRRPAEEIVVVDDGSTDDTAAIAAGYGAAVRLIQQANAGAAAARNAGVRAATGDWIAFLDADDEWLPEKLERQVNLLNAHPELVWTTGNYDECLCGEHRRAEHAPAQEVRRRLGGAEAVDYLTAFRSLLWGHTNTMLIRREVLLEAGLFDLTLPIAEDIDLWLRIAYRYPRVGFSAEPLAVYHLGIAQSTIQRYRRSVQYTDFIARHMDLAQRHGKLEEFRPCAAVMMRRWIRALLFERRDEEIRAMLDRFGDLLPTGYRRTVRILLISPRLTAFACHGASRLVRGLGLRRRLTRRPPRLQD